MALINRLIDVVEARLTFATVRFIGAWLLKRRMHNNSDNHFVGIITSLAIL